MNKIRAIFKREFAAYFNGPIGYVVAVAYLLASSFFYIWYDLFRDGEASMRAFFELQPVILTIFGPLIGMRLWAEDRREGTMELLMTMPVSAFQAVLGKFLASWAFFGCCLLLTFPLPLSLSILGDPDWGPLLGSYFGTMFLGGFCLAVGGFASSLTRDQIVAAIIGILAIAALLLAWMSITVNWLNGFWPGLGNVAQYASHAYHFPNIAKGLLDLRDAVYYLAAIFLLLWLTVSHLELVRLGQVNFAILLMFGRRWWSLSRQVREYLLSLVVGSILIWGIVVVVNLLAAGQHLQVDLTAEGIFSLSDGTREILTGLEDEVKVTWFLSPPDEMPQRLRDLRRNVTDRLDRMSGAAGGRLTYEIVEVHAEGDEDLKRSLEADRISPKVYQEDSFSGTSFINFYSTLRVTYLDREHRYIDLVNDAELEFDLMQVVLWQKLDPADWPRVDLLLPLPYGDVGGIMQNLPPFRPDAYAAIGDYLGEVYRMARLDPTAAPAIRPEAQVLVIIKPEPLSEEWRSAIREFLGRGGTVVAAVPGIDCGFWHHDYQQSWEAEETLDWLLSPAGVSVRADFIADVSSHLWIIEDESGSQVYQMPLVPLIRPSGLNQEHPLSRRQPGLIMPFATPIDVDEERAKANGFKVTVLARTSAESCLRPFTTNIYNFQRHQATYFMPPRPEEITRGRYPVAVLVEGQFAGAAPAAPPGRVLFLSSAEMFSGNFIDRFQDAYVQTNLNLLANAIESFTLGDSLLKIPRQTFTRRPLAPIEPDLFVDFYVDEQQSLGQAVVSTEVLRRGRQLLLLFGDYDEDDLTLLALRLSRVQAAGGQAAPTGEATATPTPGEPAPAEEVPDPTVVLQILPPGAVLPEEVQTAIRAGNLTWTVMYESEGLRERLDVPPGDQALLVNRRRRVAETWPVTDLDELTVLVKDYRLPADDGSLSPTERVQLVLFLAAPLLQIVIGLLRALVRWRRRQAYAQQNPV